MNKVDTSKLLRKQNYLYWVFGVQTISILFLFVILPGHVPVTLTGFQPDSINSVCMGLKLFHASPDSVQHLLGGISNHFYRNEIQLSCGNSLTPPYRTRLLLAALVGLFSLSSQWWMLCMPSILIYFLIGYVYARVVRSTATTDIRNFGFYLIPILSPHIGLFLVNVMTEGPLLLYLLLILGITYAYPLKKIYLEFPVIVCLALMALFTKQSWPLVSVYISMYLFNRFKYISRTIIIALPFAACITLSELVKQIGKALYGNDFGKWNDFAFISHLKNSVLGVFLGISHDLIHLLKFGDILGGVGIFSAIYLLFSKSLILELRIILAVSFAWGILTVASVYLADGSYGQNWRFFVFATFIAFPLKVINAHLMTKIEQ